MTGQELRTVWNFEDSLKVGDRVTVRWTNANNYLFALAEIAKVNEQSFRICLIEDVPSRFKPGTIGWTKGTTFSVPRCTFSGSGSKLWSCNNRVEPIGGYSEVA